MEYLHVQSFGERPSFSYKEYSTHFLICKCLFQQFAKCIQIHILKEPVKSLAAQVKCY